MKRVTGVGGVFFKTQDPAATLAWYRTHLGIDSADWGGCVFPWNAEEQPSDTCYTVWSTFPADSPHLAPSDAPFMVNFRVDDLEALVAALNDEGVVVVGNVEKHPNGKFAWILDLDGRKVELWEPAASKGDASS